MSFSNMGEHVSLPFDLQILTDTEQTLSTTKTSEDVRSAQTVLLLAQFARQVTLVKQLHDHATSVKLWTVQPALRLHLHLR